MARRRRGDPRIVVGYIRVSTEDQQLSPDAQRSALTRWAAADGRSIAAIFEDLGVSGATLPEERPGLVEALAAVRRHRAGALAVARRDRLARDLIVMTRIETLLAGEGARVLSADGVGAGEGTSDMVFRRLTDVLAEHERLQIRDRTRAALAVRRRRGVRYSGLPPLGFRFDGEALVVCEAEAAAVARMRELRAGGASYNLILRIISHEFKPPRGGRQWHRTTVVRILTRADAL